MIRKEKRQVSVDNVRFVQKRNNFEEEKLVNIHQKLVNGKRDETERCKNDNWHDEEMYVSDTFTDLSLPK